MGVGTHRADTHNAFLPGAYAPERWKETKRAVLVLKKQRMVSDLGVAQEVGSHGQPLQKGFGKSQCDLEKDDNLLEHPR